MSTRPCLRPLALPLVLAALAAFASNACASGLQVAPTGLEFASGAASEALWLTNTGDEELRAQVRAFEWTQADDSDRLTPTQKLVASPPMLVLAPGQRQLVRVIRPQSAPGVGESAFRLLVDELPKDAQASGVQYVLRYSVPVFVGGPAQDAAAALEWKAHVEPGALVLEAHNRGARRAQLAGVEWLAPGSGAVELVPGLLGYVLAGSTMRWSVDAPSARAADAARVRIKVDGEPVEFALSPDPAR